MEFKKWFRIFVEVNVNLNLFMGLKRVGFLLRRLK